MQVNRIAFEFALADIQQKLSNIENINNGGCGVVAYYLYSKLKSFGFNCNIVVAEGHTFHGDITDPVEKDINSFVWWRHIFVEVEYTNSCFVLIDAVRIVDGNRYSFNNIDNNHCNPESVLLLLSDKTFWNPQFDRNNIPTIIDHIDSLTF